MRRPEPIVTVYTNFARKSLLNLNGISLTLLPVEIGYDYKNRTYKSREMVQVNGISLRTNRLLTPSLELTAEDMDNLAAQWLMARGLIEPLPE